jgi:hypothetical protein
MTDEEEFSARSQLKWTREGDAWILLYRRRRMGRVVPDKNDPQKCPAKRGSREQKSPPMRLNAAWAQGWLRSNSIVWAPSGTPAGKN